MALWNEEAEARQSCFIIIEVSFLFLTENPDPASAIEFQA